MEDKQIPFDDVARQAVAECGIQDYTLALIRHSENVTYKVASPGLGAYLLRIHVPITEAMGAHGADPAAINSELLWLEALNRDTDLVLQKPVRNRAGALVTPIPAAHAALPVNCTLLRWVDGQPYHRDLESAQSARQIGEILAKLHNHAARWEIPPGFQRPQRDAAYFYGTLRGIQPALQDGRIRPADYAALETSIVLLAGMLRAQPENRQTHGLMHADAHKGNMLYHEGQIRLIDFSFCAFGNFLFDLGICLADMQEHLHPFFLDGYQNLRALPAGHPRWIEGFFVGAMVGTFSFWVANPRAQERLATKVPQTAQEYAARFNRGEHFWFF